MPIDPRRPKLASLLAQLEDAAIRRDAAEHECERLRMEIQALMENDNA